MQVDILFLAKDRFEFTKEAFIKLVLNTDWSKVRQLIAYDDGSEEDQKFWLSEAIVNLNHTDIFPPMTVRHVELDSPVKIMLDYLQDPAPLFAKIDNDVCVPPGWLPAMLSVLERYPELELLGMEAGMSGVAGRDGAYWDGTYDYEPTTNIGGVGIFRSSAFARRPQMKPDGRNGFSEFQHTYHPVRGWIKPDLPVVLLDRLPFDPWFSLSERYVEEGIQRDWPKWTEEAMMDWAWEWFAE